MDQKKAFAADMKLLISGKIQQIAHDRLLFAAGKGLKLPYRHSGAIAQPDLQLSELCFTQLRYGILSDFLRKPVQT